MTALRFVLLSLTSLFLTAVGGFLWFDSPPSAAPPVLVVSDAVIASSAAIGFGALIPQLALAVPAVNVGAQGVEKVAALIPQTPTRLPSPTATPTPGPTQASAPTNTPEASDTPAPTATLLPSLTPEPSRTPTITQTPAPVQAILSGCGEITQPGTYSLGGPLVTNRDCLNIRSNNVVVDCKGQTIDGTGYSGFGIAVRTVGLVPQRTNLVEIRGCDISGFRYGIYVEGSTNLYIHDNNVSGNFPDVDENGFGKFLGMAEGGGIRLNNSIGARVDNNVTNGQAIGIDIRGSSNVKVRGNQSSNNTAWGVNLWSTSVSEVSGNTTADNLRTCIWGAGVKGPGCDAGGIVLQYGSSGNLITNNQVTGRNGNGIFIKAHAQPCGNNNVISGNTISGALYNSVEMGFCTGTQIVGNTMSNGLDGIWFGFATNTTIKNNTIQNHRNHGIIANHVHDNVIANNNLQNDSEAIYLFWEPVNPGDFSWINISQYQTFNNTVTGNTVQNNTGCGIHLKDATNNQLTNNMLLNNGRNWWFEGNTDGNVITGNNDNSWLPGVFLAMIDRHLSP